jgi:predicted anti-sigma-YlaC factor YlaD
MNAFTCDAVRDMATDAALDTLFGDERAAVFDHLHHCPACRAVVDGYADVAAALLLAIPEADVPDELALRLRATVPAAGTASGGVASATARRRSWALAGLAVAATLLLVGVVAVAFDRPHTTPAYSSHVYSPQAEQMSLLAPAGTTVGNVVVDPGDTPWISMSVSSPLAAGLYHCEVVLDDATSAPIGDLTVSNGTGAWSGPLHIDTERIRRIQLVAPNGTVAASAVYS